MKQTNKTFKRSALDRAVEEIIATGKYTVEKQIEGVVVLADKIKIDFRDRYITDLRTSGITTIPKFASKIACKREILRLLNRVERAKKLVQTMRDDTERGRRQKNLL